MNIAAGLDRYSQSGLFVVLFRDIHLGFLDASAA